MQGYLEDKLCELSVFAVFNKEGECTDDTCELT